MQEGADRRGQSSCSMTRPSKRRGYVSDASLDPPEATSGDDGWFQSRVGKQWPEVSYWDSEQLGDFLDPHQTSLDRAARGLFRIAALSFTSRLFRSPNSTPPQAATRAPPDLALHIVLTNRRFGSYTTTTSPRIRSSMSIGLQQTPSVTVSKSATAVAASARDTPLAGTRNRVRRKRDLLTYLSHGRSPRSWRMTNSRGGQFRPSRPRDR